MKKKLISPFNNTAFSNEKARRIKGMVTNDDSLQAASLRGSESGRRKNTRA